MKKYNFKRLLAVVLAITIVASTVVMGGAASNSVYRTTTVSYDFTDSTDFSSELDRLNADSSTIASGDSVELDNIFSENKELKGLTVKGGANSLTQIQYDDGDGNKLSVADSTFSLIPGEDNETARVIYARSTDGAKYYAVSVKTTSNEAKVDGVSGVYTKSVATFYTIDVSEGKVTNITETATKDLLFKNHYNILTGDNTDTADEYIPVFTFFSFTDRATKAITWDSITKPLSYDLEISYDSENGKVLVGGTVNVNTTMTSGTKKFDIETELDLDEAVCEHAAGFVSAANDAVIKEIEIGYGITQVAVQATIDAFEKRITDEVTSRPISSALEPAIDALFADYEKLADDVKHFYKPDRLNEVKAILDQGVAYYDTFDSESYFQSNPYWEPVATWSEDITHNGTTGKETDYTWSNVTDPSAKAFWGIVTDTNGNKALGLRKNFYYTDKSDAAGAYHNVLYTLKDVAGGNNDRELYELSAKIYRGSTSDVGPIFVLEYDNPDAQPYLWSGVSVYGSATATSTQLRRTYTRLGTSPTHVQTLGTALSNLTDSKGGAVTFKADQYLDIKITYNFKTLGYDITVSGMPKSGDSEVTAIGFFPAEKPVKGVYLASQQRTVTLPTIDDISVKLLNGKMVTGLISNIGEITADNAEDKMDYVNTVNELYNNLPASEQQLIHADSVKLLEDAKALLDELLKDIQVAETKLNAMDFEDENVEIFNTSGADFSVAENPGINKLNPSSKVLAVSSSGNTASNKVAAYIDLNDIGDAINTVSVDVYINGANGPMVYFDYQDSTNWAAVYPTYVGNKLFLNSVGRTSSTGLTSSANAVTQYEVTTINGDANYNNTWAKFVFTYHKKYVTVQILFEDGNIGSPVRDLVGSLSWNFNYRSGDSITGFAVGSEGTSFTSYFDNISINTTNGSDAQTEASAFDNKYADILKLTPGTLSNIEIADLNKAIEAYNNLSYDAKAYFPLAEEILYTLKDAEVVMDPNLNDAPHVLQDRSDLKTPFTYDFQEGFMTRLFRDMGSGWGTAEVRATGDKVDADGNILLVNADGDLYYKASIEDYPDAAVEEGKTFFDITLNDETGKWYYKNTDGATVNIDKSGEVFDNKALYMNGIQNFYSIKEKFVPDQRKLTTVSMTVWAEDPAKTSSSKPIRIVTTYRDQNNYTFIELYFSTNKAAIKYGKCVDGLSTVSNSGTMTTIEMADKINIEYVITELGVAQFTFSDQHGNSFTSTYTLPDVTWDFAVSAAHGAGLYYDNLKVSYSKADWTDTEVSDIVVYYTSNTFLDTDSVVLLHGEKLVDTVASVDLIEVPDTITAGKAPQYVSRTTYDYDGVAYFDSEGNYLTKNDAGNWTYTCTTEGKPEFGKQVTLDPIENKWYYYGSGALTYIEGKSGEVTSEHHIDPIPNEDLASVFAAGQRHRMSIVQKTYSSLKFILPASLKQGMYLMKLTNFNGDVCYYYLNTPWVDYTIGSDGETTAPGKTLEIIGENLAPHIDEQLALLDETAVDYEAKRAAILDKVKVYMTDGTHNYFLKVVGVETDYRVQVQIPGDVYMNSNLGEDEPGTAYEIMVHSNFGDDYCWSIPFTIYVAPDVRDSWGSAVYNILDFKSDVGQASVNAAAVTVHALDYITNNGGGTLYFPAGYYKFDSPIVVPENVRIVGDSKETTNFLCSDYYYMIGELPSQLFYFGGNAEMKNISVYAERTGGFIGLYGDTVENVYIEGCRFRYQHNAGRITLWGPILVSSNEAYALIRAETRSFLIGAFAKTSNIQFRDYHQSASIAPEHRPIVVYDEYAEYWVLQDFYTNGGWGELYAQNSMLDGGEGDDVCLGAWSHGMYIQDWFFNKRTTNNHEVLVADMACDIPNTTLKVALDENGNRMLDENGLPTVYEVKYPEDEDFFRYLQVYVFEGMGEGQTRTILHSEQIDSATTRIYLDRPFATEIISGMSKCNIRKNREDIYYVNNDIYFGIAFGFFGAACDVVYDGNVEDRFRDFYAQDWSGDCIWYITYKDNFMTEDHYLWHSNGDSVGHNKGDSSQGFYIDVGHQGKGGMAFALRNCDQIAHYTYLNISSNSKDFIIEHNYTADVNGRDAYNINGYKLGGVYLYKNVFENCTTSTGGIYTPKSSSVVNDQGSPTMIVDSSAVNSVKGDVNLDGVIDLRDVTTIRNYITGKVTLTELQRTYADLDGDKMVTLMDATYLRYYIAGYVTI